MRDDDDDLRDSERVRKRMNERERNGFMTVSWPFSLSSLCISLPLNPNDHLFLSVRWPPPPLFSLVDFLVVSLSTLSDIFPLSAYWFFLYPVSCVTVVFCLLVYACVFVFLAAGHFCGWMGSSRWKDEMRDTINTYGEFSGGSRDEKAATGA